MLCDLLFAVCCGLDPDLLYTQTIPENRGPELMLEILTYFCYTHHHTQNRVGMCPRAGPAERYIKVGMSGDDKYMVKGLLTMFPMHEEPVSAHGLWEKYIRDLFEYVGKKDKKSCRLLEDVVKTMDSAVPEAKTHLGCDAAFRDRHTTPNQHYTEKEQVLFARWLEVGCKALQDAKKTMNGPNAGARFKPVR